MDRQKMWFFLNHWTYLSPEKREKLLLRTGDIEELFSFRTTELPMLQEELSVYALSQHEELHDEEKISEAWERMEETGIRYVSREEPAFPKRLLQVTPLIPGLFYKGCLPQEEVPSVSIIGARKCSSYGKETGYFFGKTLGQYGVQIISGMALGVDGYAMRGGVAAKAPTFGVLGCGVDICYPRENIDLYSDLCADPAKNGVISERPPGYHAVLQTDFPLRNRIISGLCDALAVIESAHRSGTLITVNYALQQNREVFAVPGRIGDRLSEGSNQLIRDGAQILLHPEDILQVLHVDYEGLSVKKPRVSLTKEEKAVCSCLSNSPEDTGSLLEKTGLPLSELLEILIRLEVKGQIRKSTMGGYVRA